MGYIVLTLNIIHMGTPNSYYDLAEARRSSLFYTTGWGLLSVLFGGSTIGVTSYLGIGSLGIFFAQMISHQENKNTFCSKMKHLRPSIFFGLVTLSVFFGGSWLTFKSVQKSYNHYIEYSECDNEIKENFTQQ